MTETEMDAAYTELCKALTALGESQASLFLGRFALLAMAEVGDAATVARLIADASEGLAAG